jgi:hypothetical protein
MSLHGKPRIVPLQSCFLPVLKSSVAERYRNRRYRTFLFSGTGTVIKKNHKRWDDKFRFRLRI